MKMAMECLEILETVFGTQLVQFYTKVKDDIEYLFHLNHYCSH